MRIAFYAPMKPPDHPIPSGDRRMAQLLIQALETGHEVVVASHLRSYEGAGDADAQARIAEMAQAEVNTLITDPHGTDPHGADPHGTDPHGAAPHIANIDLWLTYHLYHKAPDHIGPAVCEALDIPYAVVEASFAPKQAGGPWAAGHAVVERALRMANLVLQPNPGDRECVAPLLKPGAEMAELPPFIDVAPCRKARSNRDVFRNRLAARHGIDTESIWIGAAAMMRPGAKQESYRILADALRGMDPAAGRKISVLLAGDGEAKSDVRRGFNGLSDITFIDALSEAEMPEFLSTLDLYTWPGVNEAFGLALLQAMGCGVPALIGDRPGPRAMVIPGETAFLVPEGEADAYRDALAWLISDPARLLSSCGAAAMSHVGAHHSLDRAATILDQAFYRAKDRYDAERARP